MNTQIRKFYEADDYGSGHTVPNNGTIIQFLKGSHSYDGIWFGELNPKYPGRPFWWRNLLDESPSPTPLSDKPVVGKSKEEIATVLYNEYCKLCETHLVNHAVKKIIAKALDQALPVKSDAVIINIERMKDDSGREGCTYGDTNYDSLSAVYGYNLAIDNIISFLKQQSKIQ